jgi:hypothetical protein
MASIIGVQELQHTNGTSAATIASSGIVTNATPVGFVVDVQTDQSGFTDGAYTKVPFQLGGTFTFDTHSGWSNANSYYTVPTGCGGYWFLNVFIELDVTAQTGAAIITKTATAGSFNNAIARGYISEDANTANNPTIGIQTVANLNDGEIIKAELFHNYGSSRSVKGNTVALITSFQGWRLF